MLLAVDHADHTDPHPVILATTVGHTYDIANRSVISKNVDHELWGSIIYSSAVCEKSGGMRKSTGQRCTTCGGTIVNRTYGTHKKQHIYLFLPTIFGPIYYGPP